MQNDGTWLALTAAAALAVAANTRKGTGRRRGARAQLPTSVHEIGTVGDSDPIEYGGGLIFTVRASIVNPDVGARSGPWIEYVEEPEFDPDEEPERLRKVYRVEVPQDPMDEYDWVDWEAIASYTGQDLDDLARVSQSPDLAGRAGLVEDVASYHGWHELDSYPLEMSTTEIMDRWGMTS